jgi:hypothetical protein
MTEHERGARLVGVLHVRVCSTERCVDLERLHEIMLPRCLSRVGRWRPVDRWILNTFAFWELLLLYVGGGVTLGVGGFLLMRRLVPSLGAHAESRGLSSAFSISSGLFSFVLAFTIGQLYGNFTRANANAKQEATQIAQVLRAAHGMPVALDRSVSRDMLAYATEVRTHEWKLMQHGRTSVVAWQDLDKVYRTLGRARPSAGADPFFGQTLGRMNDLVVARRNRLDDVNLSLPPLFQALLLLGAVLAISSTFYFKPFGEPIQIVMIGAASTLVGMALLVAVQLDYPYSGDIAVSKAPFNSSTLVLLSGSR